jgi:hypothetical protein
VNSLVPTLVAIAVLAVIAYLIWQARPTRESILRKKTARAGVGEEVFSRFERRAIQVAHAILELARERLLAEAKRHALPASDGLSAADHDSGALTTPAAERLRGAARDLGSALADLRRVQQLTSAGPEYDRTNEQWAYLCAAFSDRYPLLAGFIERADATSLERVSSASELEAAKVLRSDLDARLHSYREIEQALVDEPAKVWSLLSVVVLFLFGGGAINDFALTLIIGILVGTYSSIFVATPVMLLWHRDKPKKA